ncbi:cell division protein FtsB [Mycetocola sp. CAN_C7]|uniref:FtsB family cell division protein n=1 Tax=Mycetocola sp. CAN_C7 TaxID=2787724 RepID=UPI0018CBE4E9
MARRPGSTRAARTRASKRNAALPEPVVAVDESEAGSWIRGIRFSGFGLLMMALLVLGIIVIAPNLKAYVEQRQQIAQLQASVDSNESDITRLTAERERWNDSTYVMTQARDRLFYVNPGEVSFIVMNDVDAALFGEDAAPVSTELTATKVDWAESLLASILSAGLADVATETDVAPVPQPEPTP